MVLIGSHRSFQFVFEYVAAFHDKLHSLKLSQVDWAGASEQTHSSKPALYFLSMAGRQSWLLHIKTP
jgi:hypothetical protein